MPNFNTIQIEPPSCWDEFEKLCFELFEHTYRQPSTFFHGRPGQAQKGVDIWLTQDGKYIGIQCKRKSVWPETNLTIDEINEEVNKALQFRPQLSEFIIATTAPPDMRIQEFVRLLTEQNKKSNLFSVNVWDWAKIQGTLSRFPDIIDRFYKGKTSLPQDAVEQIVQALQDQTGSAELADKEIEQQMTLLSMKRCIASFDLGSELNDFIEQIKSGSLRAGSKPQKIKALLFCLRLLCFYDLEKAKSLFEEGENLFSQEDRIIISALIKLKEKHYEDAFSIVTKESSVHAKSIAFLVIAKRDNLNEAFTWLDKIQCSFDDIFPTTKAHILSVYLEQNEWEQLLSYSDRLTEKDRENLPYLSWVSAIANLGQAVIPELRSRIINRVPFESYSFPLGGDEESLSFLNKATKYFNEFKNSMLKIRAVELINIVDDYLLWLELRNQQTFQGAKEKLRESMRDPQNALRRVGMALQFDLKLELDVIEKEIDKQQALHGNKSFEASAARWSIAISKGISSATEFIEYCEKYRNEISFCLEDEKVIDIGIIRMLVISGDITNAKARFKILQENGLDKETEDEINFILSGDENNTGISYSIEKYEKDGNISNLMILVEKLRNDKNHKELCIYAQKLFNMSQFQKYWLFPVNNSFLCASTNF